MVQRALVIAEISRVFPAVSRQALEESVITSSGSRVVARGTIIAVSFGVGDVDAIQSEEEFLLQMDPCLRKKLEIM